MQTLRSLALLAALAASGAASAGPVTQWGYAVTTVFDPAATVFRAGNGSTINTANLIAWGDVPAGNSQSSLAISDTHAAGVVATDFDGLLAPAEIGNTQTFTHSNFVIRDFSKKLKQARVLSSLTLTPVTPAGAALPTINSTINIFFEETPNDAGTCADVASPIPCNDIFVISGDLAPSSFDYDGFHYAVSLITVAGPLAPLADPVCLAVDNVAPGCIGFTTRERRENSVSFALAISTTEITGVIPEPGSLLLLALGLLSLGLTARRRLAPVALRRR